MSVFIELEPEEAQLAVAFLRSYLKVATTLEFVHDEEFVSSETLLDLSGIADKIEKQSDRGKD